MQVSKSLQSFTNTELTCASTIVQDCIHIWIANQSVHITEERSVHKRDVVMVKVRTEEKILLMNNKYCKPMPRHIAREKQLTSICTNEKNEKKYF
jgi:hypothetical protein